MSDPTAPSSSPGNDPRDSRLFAGTDRYGEIIDNSSYPPASQRTSSGAGMATMSARRQMRLKHSKIRRNILIAVSIVIGLLLALVATDTIKLGTGPRPSLSDKVTAAPIVPTTQAEVAGEQVETVREYTHADPLRVYIAGDSLVGSFGSTLATSLGKIGTVKAFYDSRPSTGLVNENFFNWNKQAQKIVGQYDPEMVIFMIGTNDASVVSANPKGYAAAYKEKLQDFVDVFDAEKTKIIFVLSPAMKDTRLATNLSKLDNVISSFAAEINAQVFDSESILSPAFVFTQTLKLGSKNVTVRASDGVHISSQGGKLLSDAIYSFLVRNHAINRYTDEDPISPVKVKGCCTAANTTSKPSTSSKSTSTTTSSTTTTEPETTTTSTEPPVTSGE